MQSYICIIYIKINKKNKNLFKINRQKCRTLPDFSIGGIIFRSSVTLHFLVLVDISVGKNV